MSIGHALLLMWTALAAFSAARTVQWLRQHRTNSLSSSVVTTGLATLPAYLLLAQALLWFVDQLRGSASHLVFGLLALLLGCLWALVGALLLIAGLLLGLRGPRPPGTTTVQLSHAVHWFVGTAVALLFAAAC